MCGDKLHEERGIKGFTTEQKSTCKSTIATLQKGGRTDLDSHADTCVMGNTFYTYEETTQQCTVYPYSTTYKPRTVTVAHGGTAYDHDNGHTYILDVNYGFNMTSDLSTSLLNPNQMRAHGVTVEDTPIHLSSDNESTHSLFIAEMQLRIQLELDGVISYMPTRLPTQKEVDNCIHVTLTSPIEWDPYSEVFAQQESLACNLRIVLTASPFPLYLKVGKALP